MSHFILKITKKNIPHLFEENRLNENKINENEGGEVRNVEYLNTCY